MIVLLNNKAICSDFYLIHSYVYRDVFISADELCPLVREHTRSFHRALADLANLFDSSTGTWYNPHEILGHSLHTPLLYIRPISHCDRLYHSVLIHVTAFSLFVCVCYLARLTRTESLKDMSASWPLYESAMVFVVYLRCGHCRMGVSL